MQPYYDEDGITIYHGDCLELLPHVIANLEVSLVLTDPPYGIGLDTDYGGRHRGSTKTYPSVVGDDEQFDPTHLFDYAERLVLWGANNYSHLLPPSKSWIVWDRDTHSDAADAELAWTNLGGTVRMYRHRWDGRARNGEPQIFLHPTQKPVGLMRWILERWTSPGDLILDPYMGSGPVAQACRETERLYIGIEILEPYCQVAADRLAQQVLAFG